MATQTIALNGRKVIYSLYQEVTDENIIDILEEAYPIHVTNKAQIEYLFNYYKGIQPILQREKVVRPEINNKIVENHANAIVQFKTGYLLEHPIQYVARKDGVDNDSITYLNDCMVVENKEGKDKKIANDQAICGTAYRLCLPNKFFIDDDDSPFNIYDINPKCAFVVYSSGVGNKPLVGVITYIRKNASGLEEVVCQAYTKNKLYEYTIGARDSLKTEYHIYNEIPLIEYPFNNERIGAFEVVINLLDSANLVESNRLDAVEQFVQALLVFKNVDIDKQGLTSLLELGAIKIKDDGTVEANVEYLVQELNQEQTQKLKDDILDIAYYIAGVYRNKNSGSVGNSQGAVIMRDGWSNIEARIQETELMFKTSERIFLKLALRFTRILTSSRYAIKLGDLDIKFTRRNYENTYQKTQVLTMMLGQPKISPRLAFVVCGLFNDPEEAYEESEIYYEKYLKQQKELATPKKVGGGEDEN